MSGLLFELELMHTLPNTSPDAIYYDNKLKFVNYTNANKIISLQEYYRIATQQEVDTFKESQLFEIESDKDFSKLTEGQQVRTQIAKILDGKVLERHDAKGLQSIASEFSINLRTNNNKIVIPKERESLKELLTFLLEKIYKGPLTGQTMISNSTRIKETEDNKKGAVK